MGDKKINTNISWITFPDMIDKLPSIGASSTFIYDYQKNIIHEHTILPGNYERYKENSARYRNASGKFKNLPFYPYGKDNNYPEFILELLNKSTLHKRASQSAANVALGAGLSAQNNEQSRAFLRWVIDKGLNVTRQEYLLRQLAIFGGSFIRFIFADNIGLNGISKPVLKEIYVEKFHQNRVGKEEEDQSSSDFGEVLYHWYCPDYTSDKIKTSIIQGVPVYRKYEYLVNKKLPLIHTDKRTKYYELDQLNYGHWSYLIKKESLTSEYYPSIPYESNPLLDSIIMDEAISQMDSAGIENGLTADYIITIPVSGLERLKKSDPDKYKAEVKAQLDRIHDELEGPENNKTSIVFLQDVAANGQVPQKIEVTPIPKNNDAAIQKELDQRKTAKILTAWSVTDSRLIGAPTLGALGFANQGETLKVASNLWYYSFIYPELVIPFESFINTTILELYSKENEIDIDESYKLFLKKKDYFQDALGSEVLEKILYINELRELAGFPEIPEGNTFISQLENNNTSAII